MTSSKVRFDDFVLEPANRRLTRAGIPVDVSSRYLDALALMVGNAGQLVTKDRFMDEVWRGVPVTDEALTQCIRSLRRLLGDEAARPRFIETVPKHGYRFIAPVSNEGGGDAPAAMVSRSRQWLTLGAAGTAGGGAAGVIGGLIYGLAAASQPTAPGVAAISLLLVILCLCILAALIGAAGVSFAAAAAAVARIRGWQWPVLAGAAGGLATGAATKLLGLDAFTLLFGRSPGDITGGAEGTAIGAAIGFGAWLATRDALSVRRRIVLAGAVGAATGLAVTAAGGRMMAGSLDLLSRAYPESRLGFDRIGLFGEGGFGPLSAIATGALEGGLFATCIVGAMIMQSSSFPRKTGSRH